MVKRTIILLVIYFFPVLPYQFAGKRIFCQGAGAGAGCFWPLGAGAGADRKKIPGAGGAWEKYQEPEPLEKSQEPEPEPLKNLPAPQPCIWESKQIRSFMTVSANLFTVFVSIFFLPRNLFRLGLGLYTFITITLENN